MLRSASPRRSPGGNLDAHGFERADGENDGALDDGFAALVGIEELGGEEGGEELAEVVIRGAQEVRGLSRSVGLGLLVDEVLEKLAADERGAGRLLADDADHVVAGPVARLAEVGFLAGVVLVGVEAEGPLVAVDAEPGEGVGGGLDIALGVIADAEGVEFHELAPEVLVGTPLDRLGIIEEDEHRGVADKGGEQRGEGPEGQPPEHLVLAPHRVGGLDFILEGGGEVAMPEEGHLFLEGMGRVDHPAEPPEAEIGDFVMFLELAGFAGAGVGLREGDEVRGGLGGGGEVDERGDGLGKAEGGERLDILPCAAKAGPPEQVGCFVSAELVFRKGIKWRGHSSTDVTAAGRLRQREAPEMAQWNYGSGSRGETATAGRR